LCNLSKSYTEIYTIEQKVIIHFRLYYKTSNEGDKYVKFQLWVKIHSDARRSPIDTYIVCHACTLHMIYVWYCVFHFRWRETWIKKNKWYLYSNIIVRVPWFSLLFITNLSTRQYTWQNFGLKIMLEAKNVVIQIKLYFRIITLFKHLLSLKYLNYYFIYR